MNKKEDISNEVIFDLIKNNNFDEIYKIIQSKKIKNFDFRDSNYNYFIQYIVNFNQIKILELILSSESTDIRIDILDTDSRTILYNCVKYNYYDIIKLLLKYDKTNIGISILDIKDNLGLTCLHYAVIFNNMMAFTLFLENESDPYLLSKDGSNVFILALIYKRNNMLDYLFEKKYRLNFLNNSGETLLQVAINYNNNYIIDKLLENRTQFSINNASSDYGLTALHQSIVYDNIELYKRLMDIPEIYYNLSDFFGNTPLHYIFLDKRINYIEYLFKNPNRKIIFNFTNINGDIPLHILLDSDINIDEIPNHIMDMIILESDLNIQNNEGTTCFIKIIKKDYIGRFRKLLSIKSLNFYIEDNTNTVPKMTDMILNLLVDSYYNQLKVSHSHLILDWEKFCSTKDLTNLKKILSSKSNDVESICKDKIKDIIIKEKRTLPQLNKINLDFDNGVFTDMCYYTGSPIDVLFGLMLLKKDFGSKGLDIIVDYPLTVNSNLESYYKKIGLDYPYKLEFTNIEIMWAYQKIFYPSYFNELLEKMLKNKEIKYIVIPIGIETSFGSHANILLWDIKNKTIERFEPNGANFPMGLNYNPELLDSLLENKFKQFEPELVYIPPYKFLPVIGFQRLENLETEKCKKIGDPNGFCGVWCTWWVYQRILNKGAKSYDTININMAEEFIKYIKFDGMSFKTIIRNFSKKITELRDNYLKKISKDINDWIVGNYTEEELHKLEKIVYENISK